MRSYYSSVIDTPLPGTKPFRFPLPVDPVLRCLNESLAHHDSDEQKNIYVLYQRAVPGTQWLYCTVHCKNYHDISLLEHLIRVSYHIS